MKLKTQAALLCATLMGTQSFVMATETYGQTQAIEDSTHEIQLRSDLIRETLDDYYAKANQQFITNECQEFSPLSIKGANESIQIDLNQSHCGWDLINQKSLSMADDYTYLVEVNLNDLTAIDGRMPASISINSDGTKQPLMARKTTINSDLTTDKQVVVVSNQCEGLSYCQAGLNITGENAHGELDIKILGAYLPNPEKADYLSMNSIKSTQFVNGNFNNAGAGWTWKQQYGTFSCRPTSPYINDPSLTVSPRVVIGQTNNYGLAGGLTGIADNAKLDARFSIQQTVHVPANGELHFSRELLPGGNAQLTNYADMSAVAIDLTTGLATYIHTERSNQERPFQPFVYSLSDFANHTVNFRFEACSTASGFGTFLEYHGTIGLDDVSIEINSPITPTGQLTSNSPCTIPAGGNRCTTRLNMSTSNAPVNCLWLVRQNPSLIACSTNQNWAFDWIHTNTTGHTIDLRAHDQYPSSNLTDYNNGTFLDQAFVQGQMAPSATPDRYDDVAIRGFTDDVVGDAEPLYATHGYQVHNFHDAGDQDWLIFAVGYGQGFDVESVQQGSAAAQLRAFRIDLIDIVETTPGRRLIDFSDLIPIDSDLSNGDNSVTIQNTTLQLGFYAVQVTSSGPFGEDTDYKVRAVFNPPVVPADAYDDVTSRGFTDDNPSGAEPLLAGFPPQLHNFHDQGDEDWQIFAMGANRSLVVKTTALGSASAFITAYRIVLPDVETTASGEWDVNRSDLRQLGRQSTNRGDNQLTINNDSNDVGFFAVKVTSSGVIGYDSGYEIHSYLQN